MLYPASLLIGGDNQAVITGAYPCNWSSAARTEATPPVHLPMISTDPTWRSAMSEASEAGSLPAYSGAITN